MIDVITCTKGLKAMIVKLSVVICRHHSGYPESAYYIFPYKALYFSCRNGC